VVNFFNKRLFPVRFPAGEHVDRHMAREASFAEFYYYFGTGRLSSILFATFKAYLSKRDPDLWVGDLHSLQRTKGGGDQHIPSFLDPARPLF
jgi:hypothetical protein